MNKKDVVYIYDQKLLTECDRIPIVEGRASLVHNLMKAYGLLQKVTVKGSRPASENEISGFHSNTYIDFLKKINECSDLEEYEEEAEQYGLCYDCPMLERLFDFIQVIGGGSIAAAESLLHGNAKIAINWCGGWHHAQRDEANGYCYVNDIVLAIHRLRQDYQRILYVDLDLHHGDGVENAFAYSPSVLTFSLHKYEQCFYPGTGSIGDVGYGRGRYYCVNIPLSDGIGDDLFTYVFDSAMMKIWGAYRPQVVVVQCGSDGLHGDPTHCFNLTPKGLAHCIKTVLSWKLPVLFLGGGGYNLPNVARCWTYLTSVIINEDIQSSIPEHENFLEFGPDFELDILPGCRRDCNKKDALERIIKQISDNLDNIL